MYVHEFLDNAARRTPEAIAVHHDGRDTTYATLSEESRRLAARLDALELEPGARVGVLVPNEARYFTCFFGIQRSRCVMMLLNPKGTDGENLDTVRRFGIRFLFVHSSFASILEGIGETAPQVIGAVSMDRAVPGAESFDAWCAGDPPPPDRSLPGGPGWFDCAAIRTTGGSTGKPKGVMRSALSWSLLVSDYLTRLRYDRLPVNLVVTPLTHAAGEVALPIVARGGTSILLGSTRARDILQAIETHKATSVFLPPTLIYAILETPDRDRFDLSSLEYVFYGSAPISTDRLREARDLFGPTLVQLYGLSEALSTLAIMTPEDHDSALADHPERIASCGRPGPLFTVEIVDDGGAILPPGEIGEIACRGAAMMTGYADNPEATAKAFRNGWLLSGDVGYKDEHDFLYIVDRKKDIIITGAINVYPGEVEQVIYGHPAVRECAVVGTPDDKWGEAVTAVVSLKAGQTLDEGELIAFCKAQLGSIKAPKKVIMRDELPKSGVGKILRKDIRASFWTDRARQI